MTREIMTISKEVFLRYLSIEALGGASFSPDNKEIAFIRNSPGHYQLYTTKIKKGFALWPRRQTFSEDRNTNPYWLSDGTILFAQDKGGNENFQFMLLDNDKKIMKLSKDDQAKYMVTHVTPNHVYFMANEENKARFDVYRWEIPLLEHKPEKLLESSGGLMAVTKTNKKEDKLILFQSARNTQVDLFLYDVETRELHDLTTKFRTNKDNKWNAVGWADEETLIVGTNYNDEVMLLGLLTLHGEFQSLKEQSQIKSWELHYASKPNDHEYTYYAYNVDGYSRLFRGKITREGIEKEQEIMLPVNGVIIQGDLRSFTQTLGFSSDYSKIAVTLSSPQHPMNIWIYDLKNQTWWQATYGDTGGVNEHSFLDASLHRFSSFDGLQVPYFKYVPSTPRPRNGWPTIFIIHGGPEGQARPFFVPEYQFFLHLGYALIIPNIRGSTGYGQTYMDLDNKEKRLDSIHDIQALAEHLRSDQDIDTSKLVIFGGSYGGFAVLSSLTEYPDTWKAGVDIVGISNFVTFLQNTAPWRRKLREAEYGSLEHDREMLERISPINKIDKIKAPVFIIQGDNDERVPLSESIQMYENLKNKGLRAELLRFSDEGHGITKLNNKITMYTRIMTWLQEVMN